MSSIQRKPACDSLHGRFESPMLSKSPATPTERPFTNDLSVDYEDRSDPEDSASLAQISESNLLRLKDQPQNSRLSSLETLTTKDNNIETGNQQEQQLATTRRSYRRLVWPTFVMCVPNIVIIAMLIYIIITHNVIPTQPLITIDNQYYPQKDNRYIYVRYQGTKLVYYASFLSTLAPFITGCIMVLVAIIVSDKVHQNSRRSRILTLPSTSEVGVISGLLAVSYEQLWEAAKHLQKQRSNTSFALRYVACAFVLSIILATSVIIADSGLHISTSAIETTLFSIPTSDRPKSGFKESAFCKQLDRIRNNYGLPCSWIMNSTIAKDKEWLSSATEIERLRTDSSATRQIWWQPSDSAPNSGVALVLPQDQLIMPHLDFKATTLGVSSACKLVPPGVCNVQRWGDGNTSTSFGCSSNFWGTLGVISGPNSKSRLNGSSFGPAQSTSNMMYAAFTSNDLLELYNPADVKDLSEDFTVKGLRPWQDAELTNNATVMFAWRTAIFDFENRANNGMVQSSQIFRHPTKAYVEYFVACETTSYEVDYIWFNGSVASATKREIPDGVILSEFPTPLLFTPTDRVFQNWNAQIVNSINSTEAYLAKYGQLLSQEAMSTIGAFVDLEVVEMQQQRTTTVLARMSLKAIVALVCCSLVYPVIGIILALKAIKVLHRAPTAAPLFTHAGLAKTAFQDNNSSLHETSSNNEYEMFRIGIRQNSTDGHSFDRLPLTSTTPP